MCPKYGACHTFRDPEKTRKEIREHPTTPHGAEFLHPLLPDPPPFLLKHVTKTSIAVPALPVIKLGTSDPAILPTLQGQVDCLLVGTQARLGPRAPGIHEIHTNLLKSPKIDEIHRKPVLANEREARFFFFWKVQGGANGNQ